MSENNDRERPEDNPIVLVTSDVADIFREWREEQREQQREQHSAISQGMVELAQSVRDMTSRLAETLTHLQSVVTPVQNAHGSVLASSTSRSVNQIAQCIPVPGTSAGTNLSDDAVPRISQPASEATTDSVPAIDNNLATTPALPWLWSFNSERGIHTLPEKPKFNGSGNVNPVRFLEAIERYFRRLKVPRELHLEMARDCLTGESTDWAEVYSGCWSSYNDFKTDFIHTYWSDTAQNKVRHRISTDRWDVKKTPSMLNHLAYHVSQHKMLTNQMPESVFVSEVIRHFPIHLQSLWQVMGKHTITDLAEFLRRQETTTRIVQERRVASKPTTRVDAKGGENASTSNPRTIGAPRSKPYNVPAGRYNRQPPPSSQLNNTSGAGNDKPKN